MTTDIGTVAGIRILDAMIDAQRWDGVHRHLLQNPEDAKIIINPSRGWYPLHWLCAIGSTPTTVIELALAAYPEALNKADRLYSDTPLHLVCRHSQVTTSRAHVLLSQFTVGTKDILARNVLGGTALHAAVNHNACMTVLEELVAANPQIVRVRTHEGIHVITALWNSYLQTIQGHMCIARALKDDDDDVTDRHFVRFWHKVEFLAIEHFRQSKQCPAEHKSDDQKALSKYLIHALLQCDVHINLYQLALKLHPSRAQIPNAQGNLPLNVLIEDRPFRLKEREAIMATLATYPKAAATRSVSGSRDYPLTLAIRNKIPWESGIDCILHEARFVVETRNDQNLFPFQVAASNGGNVSINTTFHLLTTQPDLLLKR